MWTDPIALHMRLERTRDWGFGMVSVEFKRETMRYALYFAGDVNRLGERGFEYHRLFAKNYECYVKDGVRVWVEASDVELLDVYGNSGALLTYLIDMDFPETLYSASGSETKCLTLDKATGEFLTYDMRYHTDFSRFGDEEAMEMYDADRYREVYGLSDTFIAFVRGLYEAGELEIVARGF